MNRSQLRVIATVILFFALTVLIGQWFGPDQGNRFATDRQKEGLGRENIGQASRRDSQMEGVVTPIDREEMNRDRSAPKPEVFNGPAYQLYHDTGMLNPRILDLAGVPVGKRAVLQENIEREWNAFSRDFESRAELVKPGDDDREIGTYRVAGSPAVAEAFRKSLEDEISPIAGKGGAEILLQYLDRESHFAGLGKYDVEFNLYYSESRGERVKAVNYKVTDPKDGRQLAKGFTTDPIRYWSRFGNSFGDNEKQSDIRDE